MQGMFAAATAELLEFQTVWIVAAILLSRVVALFAVSAGEVNHLPNVFLCHFPLPHLPKPSTLLHKLPCQRVDRVSLIP